MALEWNDVGRRRGRCWLTRSQPRPERKDRLQNPDRQPEELAAKPADRVKYDLGELPEGRQRNEGEDKIEDQNHCNGYIQLRLGTLKVSATSQRY
jgi:hypothetical protein